MNKVDKLVATAFRLMLVLYLLAVVFRAQFRPDVYRTVNVPLEYCLGILLVYIGGRWAQAKFGVSQGVLGKLNSRALFKLVGSLALLILLCVGIEYGFRNFSLTQQAIEDLRRSEEGKNALGLPIRIGWLISGSMQTKGDAGAANLSIPVKGNKAGADLEVRGIKKDGTWHVIDLCLIANRDKTVVQIPH